MVPEFASINGNIVKAAEALVPGVDEAVQWGSGAFETMKCYKNIPFLLERHLERARECLKFLDVKANLDADSLLRDAVNLSQSNKMPDATLKLIVTGGSEDFGVKPSVMMFLREWENPGTRPLRRGCRIVTAPFHRDVSSPLVGRKTLNYLEHIIARDFAIKHRSLDAIYVSGEGYVTEGSMTNIYAIDGNEVIGTAKSTRLGGITGSVVEQLCARMGIGYSERQMSIDEMLDTDGMFITNSVIEIVPAVEVGVSNNKRMVFVDVKGKSQLPLKLMTEYRKLVDEYCAAARKKLGLPA